MDRGREGGQELLGTVYAIEEAGHRPQGIVDCDVTRVDRLDLLQDDALTASGEGVGREKQHGQSVCARGRRACHHIGRSRPDRTCAGEGREAVVALAKPDAA
jgi:hypothetical protein